MLRRRRGSFAFSEIRPGSGFSRSSVRVLRPVGDLIQRTHQPQSRVSTHLACLRHCGFVKTERRGKQIVYSLALDSLEPLMVQADATMSPIASRLESCTRIGPDWV